MIPRRILAAALIAAPGLGLAQAIDAPLPRPDTLTPGAADAREPLPFPRPREGSEIPPPAATETEIEAEAQQAPDEQPEPEQAPPAGTGPLAAPPPQIPDVVPLLTPEAPQAGEPVEDPEAESGETLEMDDVEAPEPRPQDPDPEAPGAAPEVPDAEPEAPDAQPEAPGAEPEAPAAEPEGAEAAPEAAPGATEDAAPVASDAEAPEPAAEDADTGPATDEDPVHGDEAEVDDLPPGPEIAPPLPRPEWLAMPARSRPEPGWTLREVPDGPPLALAGGPGRVASVSAFCLGGRPWLALDLEPAPEADSVRADFGFADDRFEAEALREEGAGGAYVVELEGGILAGLLAGGDSVAALAIDGTQQGELSLAGSTRAMRSALAACHDF
jgi:hypothetical protein